eukprot:TRINITY_DN11062_c0_g1_i1.p2 TRINITY_DN11062_c0_g1~~TRINITY_DN11062_c0_g1_i1.p2  ORF type:complete len:225 (+),score=66.55 TRINITY_DN11062_c0_g1_i1:77-751(+)
MYEPNKIKTLLQIKKNKGESSEENSRPESFTTNVGFGTIQESLDLNTEIDQFIKDHEKWKKEYAQKQKLQAQSVKPAVLPKKSKKEEKNWIKNELIELSKKCENNIKEFASHKVEIEKIQQQKLNMDAKLTISQKALENRDAVKEMISPLDELQSKLELEAGELSDILKPGQTKPNSSITEKMTTTEEQSAEDNKVSKILADLDQDMKELDELLKCIAFTIVKN